ncbi:cytochrome c biogenesis protein ResB [Bacillus massilinigeriensis]|uniref:cytochrome c biogenesis protein ResB n=1 Tax=Bacillus massilionigeriensis TaxID=1805475 RepID=UPI00096AF1BB|nr:cytochrome c biogenesis protein ResB [Bacillus massilionigeriensis]
MNQVKCECGHVNPLGTILCESCGRILEEQEGNKEILDMRYEGSARRSQTYNKTIIDKIWNFFSSVKVGVWLIVITLLASALGTIYPQEMYIPDVMPASEYYEDQYGWLGKLYYQLGFHNLYSSWWYLILIALIGVSLVICSIDRVVPLYRALKNQRVTRHEGFLKRQRLFGASKSQSVDEDIQKIKVKLKEKHYHIREENGNLLAEKGRFSRWGPYVNHVGLIIFLLGAMLRFVPGMYIDKVLWIREGETKVIPETNEEYYLKNEKFILDFYEKGKDNEVFEQAIDQSGGMVAKNYQSNVILYKKKGDTVVGEKPELEKVKEEGIRVNQPLKFERFALYQVSYKLNELDKMSFTLIDKESKKEFGDITIDLYEPQKRYDLGDGYSVEIRNYFPDFVFNEDQEPTTKSKVPNNPAFVFEMFTPDKKDPEISFVAIKQNLEPFGDNKYKMQFKNIETKNVSALTVRKDLTLWVIILGGIVFMIGVIQGAYWNHRRIWVTRTNGEVWVAAHTNKNWFGLKKEIQTVLSNTEIQVPEDKLQNEKSE